MWIKLFRQRKLQTVMIFFVILLCTALLNGAVLMLTSLNEPFERLEEETKPAELNIYLSASDITLLTSMQSKFESLENVEHVEPLPCYEVGDNLYNKRTNEKIEVYSNLVEYNKVVHDSIRMVKGNKKNLPNLKEHECIVPVCIMNDGNLKINDKITIEQSDVSYDYTIVGSYVEPYSTSTAFDSSIIINHIPNTDQHQTMYRIYGKGSANPDTILNEYRTKYPGVFPGYIMSINDVKSNSMLAVNVVAAAFLAIGLIMLLVTGLIINFMIRHSLKTDGKSIAVYKTLGYTCPDIQKMYLYFYLVIVSVGCIFGIFFSKFVSKIALSQVYSNLGEVVSVNVLKTGIPCFILINLFIFFIVCLVMQRTKRVKPVYALNGCSSSNTKRQNYKGSSSLSFTPVSMTKRNILREKKGTTGILIIAIVTVIGVNFAMISLDVAYSQKENNNYWVGVDPSHIMIYANEGAKYEQIESVVKEDTRVDHYLNEKQNTPIYLNYDKDNREALISAFVFDSYNGVDLPVTEGHNPKNANEIAIGTVVADKLHLQTGDYLECYLGNGTKVDLLVSGIFQTYFQEGMACRLCTSTFIENKDPFSYNCCSIYLKDVKDISSVIRDLKEQIGNKGTVLKRTDAYAAILNMIVEPQIKGIPPMTVLVFIIAAINIFSIILLRNSSNEKTFSIYKCIGYTTKDLIRSNLYYVGMVAGVAIVIGVPAIILSYGTIMKMALGVFNFKSYPYTLNIPHLIYINLAVVVVFVLSTLLSSRSIYHVDVRDLVIE